MKYKHKLLDNFMIKTKKWKTVLSVANIVKHFMPTRLTIPFFGPISRGTKCV